MALSRGCAAMGYDSFCILLQGSRHHRSGVVRSQDQKSSKERNGTGPMPAIKKRLGTRASGSIKPGRRLIHQEIKKDLAERLELNKKLKAFWGRDTLYISCPRLDSQSRGGPAAWSGRWSRISATPLRYKECFHSCLQRLQKRHQPRDECGEQ